MAPFSYRNRFIAPTFENGVNGWTVSGAGAAGVTLSASTAYSLHGTKCLRVSIPAGAGEVRLVPPSFPIIESPYRVFGFGFSVASTTGSQLSYGFERFKPDLTYHNESLTLTAVLGASLQKFGRMEYLGPDNAPFIGGLLPKIIIGWQATAQELYFDGFVWLDAADQEHYPYILTPVQMPQISGSWPGNDSYTYSWTGAVEASASLATHKAELFVPAAFNRGDTIAVTGTGFPASSTVDIIIGEHWNRVPAATGVPTDASGSLSTTVTAPYSHSPGMAYIVGKPTAGGAAGSMRKQEVWTSPPDLSVVTNYFPNPNGQTLAVDGVTPKHFGPGYNDGDVLTRVSVDGAYRVRMDPEWGNAGLNLGPAALTTLGLDNTGQYIIKARLHSDSVSGDPWAYLQTSSGNSDNGLTGPGPWDVLGTGVGPFDAPGEFIAYSWPDGATVDLDHVSLVNGASYLSLSNRMNPGDVIDGYKIGLRPGRQYQLAGYTEGVFKVRTGTSAGTLSDLLVWDAVFPETWTGGPVANTFTIPAGHNVIQLESSGATGDYSWAYVYDYIPYFDGDTPDDGTYTYSWAGTPHDSASIRTLAAASVTAQVFVGGIGLDVTEMRVVVDGTLIDVTEAGG